jgi:GNAT superfamily N-acetyltransferase
MPPESLCIRPVTAADMPAVALLWHGGWHDAHGRLFLPEIVAERTVDAYERWLATILEHSYAAFVDGALAGFYAIDGDELDQFYVDPGWRGRGLAGRLIADAERALAARGVRDAWLVCAVGNERARRFYGKAGWTEGPVVDGETWRADGSVALVPCHRFTKQV